jgi:phosphatidate phosphatase PAH1
MRCCMYLWKWDDRLVVSDVDGTITKSDVMGHVMTAVGRDWTHAGIAGLYRRIRENGYKIIYLSSRSISQAAGTRDFLHNLRQDDGKHAMPLGPVILSPDGLFRSVTREVILRRPHEFKIAALSNIRGTFPAHVSPFHAGFGNRSTDERAYLEVGVPVGRVFTINPKGEISHLTTARRVDALATLQGILTHADQVFPVMSRKVGPSRHGGGGDRHGDHTTSYHHPHPHAPQTRGVLFPHGSGIDTPRGTSPVRSMRSETSSEASSDDDDVGDISDHNFDSFAYWRPTAPALVDI